MDTNSTNNQNQPKSWDELVNKASQAEPPGDLDILSGVQRAIAAEQWSTTDAQDDPGAQASWLDELVGLVSQKWALAGLSVLTIAVVAFGIVAVDASTEAVIAYELSSWFNP